MKNILAILICFYPVLLFAQEITINEVSQENNSVIIPGQTHEKKSPDFG